MHPGLFLDRDGVIIENREAYVRNWDDVAFYPQAISALVRLSQSPYKIVMVTNQSVIGRGIITQEQAEDINCSILETIRKAGGRIDGVWICPHAPSEKCSCRKPAPGMILQAALSLSIDLSLSIMVGDAITDIQAGKAAGVMQTILVRTGRGADQLRQPEIQTLKPFLVLPSLADVTAYLNY